MLESDCKLLRDVNQCFFGLLPQALIRALSQISVLSRAAASPRSTLIDEELSIGYWLCTSQSVPYSLFPQNGVLFKRTVYRAQSQLLQTRCQCFCAARVNPPFVLSRASGGAPQGRPKQVPFCHRVWIFGINKWSA